MTDTATNAAFHQLLEIISDSGVHHVIHEHRETRIIDDAARNLILREEVDPDESTYYERGQF